MSDLEKKHDTPDAPLSATDKSEKESHPISEEVIADDQPKKEDNDATTDDDVTLEDKKNAEVMALSAIESTEVTPQSADDTVEDPDKEVTIIPSAVARTKVPWWRKRTAVVAEVMIALVIVLLAVPMTRYMALGWLWHRDVSVTVQDTQTGNAIADATVTVGDRTAVTDAGGVALLRDVPLGSYDMAVQKKYYNEEKQAMAVDVLPIGETMVSLRANGIIRRLTVVDRLTDAPVRDASVVSADSKFGKTNAKGQIDILIPKGKKELEVTTTSPQHNVQKVMVTTKTDKIALVPTGSVYFLAKQDGRINVLKANYDGSASKVIVAGTGDENDATTMFVTSTDWKYAVLRAKRAPNKPESLYIVSTKDDTYAVMDDTTATFAPVGWLGHSFVYQSTLMGNDQWRERSTSLKSYNAETGKTITLDENTTDPASTAGAALYETIDSPLITGGTVVYAKTWTTRGEKTISSEGKQARILSIKPDGSDQKTLKSTPATDVEAVALKAGSPDVAYATITSKRGVVTYGEITAGAFKDLADGAVATRTYPAYIASPDGMKTLWADKQDDTYTMYLGDKSGDSKQQVSAKGALQPYAWLTGDRIIVRKGTTELAITTIDYLKNGKSPLVIGNYFQTTQAAVAGYGAK